MEMDPLQTISPKSMKDRFCFDPHKIPSGSDSEFKVTEWRYFNNGTQPWKGNKVSFDIFIKVHWNLIQFPILKSLRKKGVKRGTTINLRAGVLQHQCGMVYKATDASLLSSGIQPFVVEVIISRFLTLFDNFSFICYNSSNFSVKCVGTLISPGHVLTLASCFMIEGVKTYLTFPITQILIILLILRTHSKFKRTSSKNVVLITVGRIVDDGFTLMK